MRCPKCSYITFDSGERCRNCGYEFSFTMATGDAPDPAAFELPIVVDTTGGRVRAWLGEDP